MSDDFEQGSTAAFSLIADMALDAEGQVDIPARIRQAQAEAGSALGLLYGLTMHGDRLMQWYAKARGLTLKQALARYAASDDLILLDLQLDEDADDDR